MEQIHKIKHDRIKSRKAVAPIIATLLMKAIAVVGGVMIYVFTQGFFGNSSISASPTVDTITMSGYDMREIIPATGPPVVGVLTHELTAVEFGDANTGDGKLSAEDGVIYIRNVGQKPYSISKLEVNGKQLSFESDSSDFGAGEFALYTAADASDTTVSDDFHTAQTILPGEEGSILISFDTDNESAAGRTIPVRITSAGGSVYNFNVVIGSRS